MGRQVLSAQALPWTDIVDTQSPLSSAAIAPKANPNDDIPHDLAQRNYTNGKAWFYFAEYVFTEVSGQGQNDFLHGSEGCGAPNLR